MVFVTLLCVVKICDYYGDLYAFDVCFDRYVVYGVWCLVCGNLCSVLCVVVCCLFLAWVLYVM